MPIKKRLSASPARKAFNKWKAFGHENSIPDCCKHAWGNFERGWNHAGEHPRVPPVLRDGPIPASIMDNVKVVSLCPAHKAYEDQPTAQLHDDVTRQEYVAGWYARAGIMPAPTLSTRGFGFVERRLTPR